MHFAPASAGCSAEASWALLLTGAPGARCFQHPSSQVQPLVAKQSQEMGWDSNRSGLQTAKMSCPWLQEKYNALLGVPSSGVKPTDTTTYRC